MITCDGQKLVKFEFNDSRSLAVLRRPNGRSFQWTSRLRLKVNYRDAAVSTAESPSDFYVRSVEQARQFRRLLPILLAKICRDFAFKRSCEKCE